MPTCRTVVAACLLLIACAAPTAGTMARLDWLSGRWCADHGEETVEELWLPPRANMLLGLSRTYTDAVNVSFEYLRIVESDGVLEYLAQPGGRPPTAFRLAVSGDGWLRFENPEHDFPQRIEYRRLGERLEAEIAGPGGNGEELVITFDYMRCPD